MKQTITTFNQIHEEYEQDIYRFSFWLSGSSEDARDITSETFIRLWTAENNIKAETVKGYLLTIARNVYLQSIRKHKKLVDLTPDIIDTSPSPCEITESQFELQNVVKAIQKLPEIERSILIMKTYVGLSYQEIAHLVGLPISTLKVKVHRARTKLASTKTKGAFL